MLRAIRSAIAAANAWAKERSLPAFFSLHTRTFSSEYRVDLDSAGWDVSWRKFTGPVPGFPTVWICHLDSGYKAKIGLHPSLSKPLAVWVDPPVPSNITAAPITPQPPPEDLMSGL